MSNQQIFVTMLIRKHKLRVLKCVVGSVFTRLELQLIFHANPSKICTSTIYHFLYQSFI